MTTGLFIGRFQPVHKGHVHAVRHVLRAQDRCIVIVGSAQASHEPRNPLTAGERFQLLEASLPDELPRLRIVPVLDLHRNALWYTHLRALLPPFHAIYSNNPLVQILASEAGFHVEAVPLQNRETWRSSYIREAVLKGSPWREHVPAETVPLLQDFGFERRIKALAGFDA